MSAHDGGSAFPLTFRYQADGMSLRDYFAIHSTQPGMSELVKAAGLSLDRTSHVYLQPTDSVGQHFIEWWESLTLERQCDLSAAVRFAQADAMLKARQSVAHASDRVMVRPIGAGIRPGPGGI